MKKIVLALLAFATLAFSLSCSATDKKIETVGTGVADAACLAKIPPEYKYICDLGDGALNGLIDTLGASKVGSATVPFASLPKSDRQSMLAAILDQKKAK